MTTRPEDVVDAVADWLHIPAGMILEAGRSVPLPSFRRVAAHAAHELTPCSWFEVAGVFGADRQWLARSLNPVERLLLDGFLEGRR